MDEEMGLEPKAASDDEIQDLEIIEESTAHHRGYYALPADSKMWSGGKVYYRFENRNRRQSKIVIKHIIPKRNFKEHLMRI